MNGPLSSLLAMLALSSMMDGPRQSPQEQYEQFRKRARKGNISFLMGAWTEILGDKAFEPVTIDDLIQAFMDSDGPHSGEIASLDPATRDLAMTEMETEFQACISHWVEHGTLERIHGSSSAPNQYRLTEYGKGFIKGFVEGAKCDGKVAFQVIKKLTPEQMEQMVDSVKAKMEDDPEACPGCGGHHEDNPLDEIAKMFSRKGRSSQVPDSLEDFLRMLRKH